MKKYSSISVFDNRGFTLLEILIAITLLAFITLGVVNITEDAVLTMERTTEINKNNLQIETAFSRFEWDFSQIYSPLYFSTTMSLQQLSSTSAMVDADGNPPPDENQNNGSPAQVSPELQQYFEQLVARFERNEHFSAVSKEGLPIPRFYSPEKDIFEFFTTSNRRKVENLKQSHFAWVRYALAEQEDDPEAEENPNIPKSLKSFVRYFSADDPYSEKRIEPDQVRGAVLLRNVSKLEFQFWDLQKRKWETSLKSIPNGESLIRGVKLLITWYDSTGFERSTSRIFRTHWPMVVPQDPVATPNRGATTSGANAGQDGTNAPLDQDDQDDF